MQKWYNNLSIAQKVFVYFVSIPLILVWGVGLVPVALMIFLALGKRPNKAGE